MHRIVALGAGGHAREVMDIVRDLAAAEGTYEPHGFLDDDPAKHGQAIDGVPVLGGFGWLAAHAAEVEVVCAVGQPRVAKELAAKAAAHGARFATVVSPAAHVSRMARVGEGAVIFSAVAVNAGAEIGRHVMLNVASTVSHDARVADYCNVNPGAHLAGNVGAGEGCYVGMGANVIQGITLGAWSTIGAGAVVIRDVPPGATVVGVPAELLERARRS